MKVAVFLAFKEIWHSRARFLLISLVVALITTLVLFIAALAEGLGSGNREYLEKLNGELVVYQENLDLSIAASRIGRSKLNALRRVPGVAAVGQVAIVSMSIVMPGEEAPLDVSVLGVEPGQPGEPPAFVGQGLGRSRAREAVIDQRVVEQTGLGVGDIVTIKSIQGTQEEFYDLTVVGISDARGFFLQPTIFVPYLTWEQIRPRGANETTGEGEFISNIVVVKLVEAQADLASAAKQLEKSVDGIEVVNRKTAYEATPGYAAQQSTLDTQRYFSFFIGILVVGGFFQIQTLQKVAQIGMLKAIGASARTIALASLTQIVAVNAIGVLIGVAGSLALSLTFPPTLPVIFTGQSVLSAILALLVIGPAGGLVSIWLLLRVEPLTALGLAQ
jgi:putative ABC transport system permease protein